MVTGTSILYSFPPFHQAGCLRLLSSCPSTVCDRLGKNKATLTVTTSASVEVTPYRTTRQHRRPVNNDIMSYRPPPSPPLPTFAIKDLAGPSNPPGLISISRRRYDATLKSNPNAALLYLDDDDGELITVGSSLELSQRLEEPVPKYIRELRDPADGKLVHVFDINHTTAGLLEWRDHEAYSSKHFNSLSSPFHGSQIGIDLPSKHLNSNVTYPSLPISHDEDCTTGLDISALQVEPSDLSQKKDIGEAFNLLDGIEQHLSGLANVLQIAANTLQKAADKTKETDSSVIEDILKGVKGILTEVGAFGVEAFKELGSEINTAIDEQSASTSAHTPDGAAPVKEEEKIAAQLAQEAKEEFDLRSARKDSQHPVAIVQTSTSPIVDDLPSENLVPKVKFSLPEAPVRKELTQLDFDRLIPLHARSARSDQDSKLSLLDEPSASKLQNPSFLDDSSEDADFTARYPPLSTVRRARSTIERPLQWPADRREKAKAQCKYYRALAVADRQNPQQPTRVDRPSATSPFASPPPNVAYEPITIGQPVSGTKPDSADVVQKPLPGAWPDIKNDSAPALPISSESSGDFFNRMVGRGRPSRYRPLGLDSGLHRANTTASSNPASRLNGPFDPGFPYDPSPAASYRPNSFRPYHSHRRSASPPGWGKMLPPARSRSDKRLSLNPETNLSPSSSSTTNFGTPLDVGTRTTVDSSIHRAVKHYRSVPQFHVPPSPPYQIMNTKPVISNIPRPLQRSTTDFLTGPSMPMYGPMPPPMPFTTRPNFPSRPTPPNLWAPWQSSPPTQLPADEGTNVSSLNGFSTHNESNSPVSSQSTTAEDLEVPDNEPPFPSAQPQSSSPSTYRYPTPPRPLPALPTFFPPPPVVEPMQIEPVKDKIDECVEQLKMCGFGVDDDNLKNRLHVYAVAADGDVTEAVEMIEQDRRMTAPGRFDGA